MPETQPPVLTSIDARGVAMVTLNRPERNNAYNDAMITDLLDGVAQLASDDDVRIIVIRGNGAYFQAGADLKFMNELATLGKDANLHMSQITADAVRHFNACPKPTLAPVHGGCFGGGLGILAACDVVIASAEAQFSITEVRWGLVATPIIPQLCDAMGLRALRRYALTAEKFNAETARDSGLVHEICETGKLDEAAAPVIDALLQASPSAIAETKQLILETAAHLVDDESAATLATAHAARRRSLDAIEGLASFNQRRPASWYQQ